MAERDAAVHAARRLGAQLLVRERQIELQPVPLALLDRPARRQLAMEFEKAFGISHAFPSCPPSLPNNGFGSLRPAGRPAAQAPARRLVHGPLKMPSPPPFQPALAGTRRR